MVVVPSHQQQSNLDNKLAVITYTDLIFLRITEAETQVNPILTTTVSTNFHQIKGEEQEEGVVHVVGL
jgi:hypothetical protein